MTGAGPIRAVLIPLLVVAALALLTIFNNFAVPLLPPVGRAVDRTAIVPVSTDPAAHAFAVPMLPDAPESPNDRSLVTLFENGNQLSTGKYDLATISGQGHGVYALIDGRLVFSSSDNSDPRTNGRDYDLTYERGQSRRIGYGAVVVFLLCAFGVWWLARTRPAPIEPLTESSKPTHFRWHVYGAALLLLIGLYCSTGTLSPYANNGSPWVATSYRFLYNPDHSHFKLLYQFVDGQDRTIWDGAIFLRRILFTVLTYPFMKVWGFEIGGAIGSLVLNTAGLIGFLFLIRRQLGEHTAIYAGWLLALYPGAAYWGGLPYPYATIFPFCLLLTAGMLAIDRSVRFPRVIGISLLMGIAYLGYDLIVYFLPATALVLLWRRRYWDAAATVVLQALPLLLWLLVLQHGLHQSLANSNSAAFGVILNSYLHVHDLGAWWAAIHDAPAIGLNVFFGSGFVFLPVLVCVAFLVNPLTARLRLNVVEGALLAVTLGLFLFNNLAPAYTGPWELRGTWVARLYQPCFPALILFLARWLTALPRLPRSAKISLGALVVGCLLGNALVVFGPILNNPARLSELTFFAFADSRVAHSMYESNLENYGRRPLGFRPPAGVK